MTYVECSCGGLHWGRYGAAGLLLTDPTNAAVLLQKRSAFVHAPNTWALPGGALHRDETPTEAALREAREEHPSLADLTLTPYQTVPGLVHRDWSYTYVLAETLDPVRSGLVIPSSNWESEGAAWVLLENVPDFPLHPALADDWPRLATLIGGGRAS